MTGAFHWKLPGYIQCGTAVAVVGAAESGFIESPMVGSTFFLVGLVYANDCKWPMVGDVARSSLTEPTKLFEVLGPLLLPCCFSPLLYTGYLLGWRGWKIVGSERYSACCT